MGMRLAFSCRRQLQPVCAQSRYTCMCQASLGLGRPGCAVTCNLIPKSSAGEPEAP